MGDKGQVPFVDWGRDRRQAVSPGAAEDRRTIGCSLRRAAEHREPLLPQMPIPTEQH